MIDRRALFWGILGACTLRADGGTAWGLTNNDLRIGLHLEKALPQGMLALYLQNTGLAPMDLYIADGFVPRFAFIAVSPDRKRLKIEDRLLYLPCAGLCGFPPVTESLAPGATRKWSYAFNRQFYVPPGGPNTTLGKLLEQDYGLQVSFDVTAQQLTTSHLSSDLWLGYVDSAVVRMHW